MGSTWILFESPKIPPLSLLMRDAVLSHAPRSEGASNRASLPQVASLLVPALVAILALSGCGRRGSSSEEPPGTASADSPDVTPLDAGDAPEAGDVAADSPEEPPAPVRPPLASTPVPDRIRPEDRFVHPDLVRAIRVQSGLIPPAPPRVEGLLLRSDLRELLGFGGAIEERELPGKEPSPNYNAVRYAMDDTLGCALQRWQYESAQELDAVYVAYTEALLDPIGEPRVDVASVRSEYFGLQTIAFKHSASRSMLHLSCDAELVPLETVRELVGRVALRL